MEAVDRSDYVPQFEFAAQIRLSSENNIAVGSDDKSARRNEEKKSVKSSPQQPVNHQPLL